MLEEFIKLFKRDRDFFDKWYSRDAKEAIIFLIAFGICFLCAVAGIRGNF